MQLAVRERHRRGHSAVNPDRRTAVRLSSRLLERDAEADVPAERVAADRRVPDLTALRPGEPKPAPAQLRNANLSPASVEPARLQVAALRQPEALVTPLRLEPGAGSLPRQPAPVRIVEVAQRLLQALRDRPRRSRATRTRARVSTWAVPPSARYPTRPGATSATLPGAAPAPRSTPPDSSRQPAPPCPPARRSGTAGTAARRRSRDAHRRLLRRSLRPPSSPPFRVLCQIPPPGAHRRDSLPPSGRLRRMLVALELRADRVSPASATTP